MADIRKQSYMILSVSLAQLSYNFIDESKRIIVETYNVKQEIIEKINFMSRQK